MARAAAISGIKAEMGKKRAKGIEIAQSIANKEEQQWVLHDLNAIQ